MNEVATLVRLLEAKQINSAMILFNPIGGTERNVSMFSRLIASFIVLKKIVDVVQIFFFFLLN